MENQYSFMGWVRVLSVAGWLMGVGYGAYSSELNHSNTPIRPQTKSVKHTSRYKRVGAQTLYFKPVKPFNNEKFTEGEVSFEWVRPEGNRQPIELFVEKIVSTIGPTETKSEYFRKSTGSRRTRSLGVGAYRWTIRETHSNLPWNWIQFEVVSEAQSFASALAQEENSIRSPASDGNLEAEAKPKYENPPSFLNWPKLHIEAGPSAVVGTYKSQLSKRLSSSNLTMTKGFHVNARWTLGQKLTTLGYFEETVGQLGSSANFSETVVFPSADFRSASSGLGIRYRVLSDPQEGLGYFLGSGFERAHEYRFGYISGTNVVTNRPNNLDLVKFSTGVEYRGYQGLRGTMELGYYNLLQNSPEDGSASSRISTTEKVRFSVDSSLLHGVSEKFYMGVGLKYVYHQYDLDTNEQGSAESGSVGLSQFQTKLLLGVEF